MFDSKYFTKSPTLLRIATPIVVLFTLSMYASFAEEPASPALFAFLGGITVATAGLVIATVSPRRGRWGLKLVTAVIATTYVWYALDQLLVADTAFDPTVSHAEPNPYTALVGFLIIGLPCLRYTFRGMFSANAISGEQECIHRPGAESKPRIDSVSRAIKIVFVATTAFGFLMMLWSWIAD